MQKIKIGSHVKMAGKEMFLGSVKEAESYGANVLMLYTGAPQNTVRKVHLGGDQDIHHIRL